MKILLIPPSPKHGSRPRFRWFGRRKPKPPKAGLNANDKLAGKPEIRGQGSSPDAPENSGLMVRMNRKFASIQEQIERSDSYFARMWRWVWLKLQVWIPTDEPMLRQLRNESSVVLAYPSHWTSERAMTSWRDYLWRRRLIAAIWVAFYVILAPVVTLVAFLPGPNVLGYWFLYRGVCDGLTVWGTHRGLRLWPPQTEIIDGQPESGSGIIAALKMEPASHPAPTPVAAETSNQERS